MSKGENLEQISIQISNLRKCRDGLIPYSSDSLRKVKQSFLEQPTTNSTTFTSSSSSSTLNKINEIPLRR